MKNNHALNETTLPVAIQFLQDNILPVVIYSLIVLAVLFVAVLIIHLIVIFVKSSHEKYINNRTAVWEHILDQFIHKGDHSANFSRKEKAFFKPFLIDKSLHAHPDEKQRIQKLYKKLGYSNDDIRLCRSRLWWRRIKAIERFELLELAEMENNVLPLLKDERMEVRLAALRMLAATGSRKLGGILPAVFADNTRWTYRYLVNILYGANIPVSDIRQLAASPDRDLRKAAAMLLGKEGNAEAIPLLRTLSNDGVKDVRREAVRSLVRIKSDEILQIFNEKVNDKDPEVRAETAKGFGKLKNPISLPSLEQLADDTDFEVRYQAFYALTEFGETGRIIIEKFSEKYPEMTAQFLCAKCL
ncbi:MAG: HEAT repeat domain-containing protein [bacterium]